MTSKYFRPFRPFIFEWPIIVGGLRPFRFSNMCVPHWKGLKLKDKLGYYYNFLMLIWPLLGGVIIYQNPKIIHIARYYKSMGKMRLIIP